MPDFWLDSDSFILPYRTAYRFDMVPQFWDFLKQKAEEGVIASPEFILDKELCGSGAKKEDDLEKWAKPLRGIMFIDVDESVQASYNRIADYVQENSNYKSHWINSFLRGADPWVIAYARARGGKVVTFETRQPEAKKPKIPDVADYFNIKCITIWDMLSVLKWKA